MPKAAKNVISFLSAKGPLLAHIQLASTSTPSSSSAELLPSWVAPSMVPGVVPPPVQDTSLLVELHVVPVSPALQPAKAASRWQHGLWWGSHSLSLLSAYSLRVPSTPSFTSLMKVLNRLDPVLTPQVTKQNFIYVYELFVYISKVFTFGIFSSTFD